MKKSNLLFISLLAMIVVLSGCDKDENKVENNIDQQLSSLTQNNGALCQYENDDFDFKITIPVALDKCHPQRLIEEKYTDIEFFVPTNDIDYPQEVRSYAKILVVRIAEKEYFEDDSGDLRGEFIQMRGKGDKIYAIKFWSQVPADWEEKWNDEMKQDILDSFDLN